MAVAHKGWLFPLFVSADSDPVSHLATSKGIHTKMEEEMKDKGAMIDSFNKTMAELDREAARKQGFFKKQREKANGRQILNPVEKKRIDAEIEQELKSKLLDGKVSLRGSNAATLRHA